MVGFSIVGRLALAGAALAAFSTVAFADSIKLKNGDTLTGKIDSVSNGTIAFNSPVFGGVKIPIAQVEKYEFDTPQPVQLRDRPLTIAPVAGTADIVTVDGKSYPTGELKSINPAADKATGSIVANGSLARGNTNRFTLGADASAVLRRQLDGHDDRFTFGAGYQFGRTGGGAAAEPAVTDTDNWFLLGKYDKFWSPKLYGYATAKLEHDYIARLDFRLAPGVGLGYQWLESPLTHFSTEAGFGYVYERYADFKGTPGDADNTDGESNQYVSVRLAYHFDHKLNDKTLLFHDLEFLPAVSNPGNYNLTTDAGLRVQLTEHMFSEFKVIFKRDSEPADEALKNDLLYTVGVGWQF